MHAQLVQQADDLMDCTENFPEERELEALSDTIEAYERQRRPVAKNPGRQWIVSVIPRGAENGSRGVLEPQFSYPKLVETGANHAYPTWGNDRVRMCGFGRVC